MAKSSGGTHKSTSSNPRGRSISAASVGSTMTPPAAVENTQASWKGDTGLSNTQYNNIAASAYGKGAEVSAIEYDDRIDLFVAIGTGQAGLGDAAIFNVNTATGKITRETAGTVSTQNAAVSRVKHMVEEVKKKSKGGVPGTISVQVWEL